MSFDSLGLRAELLSSIKRQGYTTPTPVQEKSIPVVLSGRDILAGAQTGTGKTAAFTLPLLHVLSNKGPAKDKRPRALVLAPTRELAAQVGESIKTYGHGLRLRSTTIFGGVSAHAQIRQLRQGVDIVIGTPGRLLDLCGQRALDLSRIEHLVLDEADRMLDMGFIHDIRKIIALVPKNRQTLFFSATYSNDIKKLADTILTSPELVEVARRNTAAELVKQSVYHTPKSKKRTLLAQLIRKEKWQQVLIFARTKHGADRLAKQLTNEGIKSAAIHGNKSQGARTRALANFKACKVRTLVATDIAARGLDIDSLPHVVNYDLPEVPEDYVHRIGRTGRAGNSGAAVSLVAPEEVKLLTAIERLMKSTVEVRIEEGLSGPAPRKAASTTTQGRKAGPSSNDRRPQPNQRQRRRRRANWNRSKPSSPRAAASR